MYIRTLIFTLFIVSSVGKICAGSDFVPLYYWIHFSDKDDSPYSIDNPELFLSERSLQRRLNQGIGISMLDLPVNQSYVDMICADQQVLCFYTSRWMNGMLIKTSSEESLSRIRQFPFVEGVEYVKPELPPPTKASTGIAGVNTKFGTATVYAENPSFTYSDVFVNQVNGRYLHDNGYLGEGMLIAVLDAGFSAVDSMTAFASIRNNGQIKGIRDFVNPDQYFYSTHTHGTYVLSTMAADIPGLLRGTGPGADYFLIRTEDGGSEFRIEEYNWLAGAELADSIGADIINSSLGYTVFDDPAQNYTYADMDGETSVVAKAAKMAAERGILVVNSAGNYGDKAWRYIGSPADNELVFSIGAVDTDNIRTAFSSVGPSADGRIKPDVMTMGRAVIVAGPGNTFLQASGTSFSAPILSGMLACLWQKFPKLTAYELKNAVMKTSSIANNPDNEFGYGIPNFQKASNHIASLFASDGKLSDWNFSVYPNPVSQYSQIQFFAATETEVNFTVINSVGQFITSFSTLALPGVNNLPVSDHISGIRQGVYFIVASGRGIDTKVIKAIF